MVLHFANDWKTTSIKLAIGIFDELKPFAKFVNFSSSSNYPFLQYTVVFTCEDPG
jgi:hypothetical protein